MDATTSRKSGSSRKEKTHHHHHRAHKAFTEFQRLVPWVALFLLVLLTFLLLVGTIFPQAAIGFCPDVAVRPPPARCPRAEEEEKAAARGDWSLGFAALDCEKVPQASPVVAHKVEGMKYPFMLSLSSLGTADHPDPNVARLLQGQQFQEPEVSRAVQVLLEALTEAKAVRPGSVVVDVGAGSGAAALAAAAAGVRVVALEPSLGGVQRLCDGVTLNRFAPLVRVHMAAASNATGNVTLYEVPASIQRSSLSLAGARLASSWRTDVVPRVVPALTVDALVPDGQHVALLMVAAQGWELRVLEGARKLLGRPPADAPHVLYESDRPLLRASNATQEGVRAALRRWGYDSCRSAGPRMHCHKTAAPAPS